MSTSRSVAAPALVGAVLAAVGLGINWSRLPGDAAPGRELYARVFLVAAAVLGVVGAAGADRAATRARHALGAAAVSMVVALVIAIRQAGESAYALISPTAYVVVVASVGAFALARRALTSHSSS